MSAEKSRCPGRSYRGAWLGAAGVAEAVRLAVGDVVHADGNIETAFDVTKVAVGRLKFRISHALCSWAKERIVGMLKGRANACEGAEEAARQTLRLEAAEHDFTKFDMAVGGVEAGVEGVVPWSWHGHG